MKKKDDFKNYSKNIFKKTKNICINFYKNNIKKYFTKDSKNHITNFIKKVTGSAMKTGVTGIKRIINAFKYSFDGLKAVYKSEEAFREDLLLSLILFIIIVFCPFSFIEKILLFSTLFVIIFAELINTAIEVIIDRISEKIHPLSKIAKDIGSAIVFVSFIYLGLVWIIVLFNNIF